jgi:AraC-like DNA-binding protein
VWQQGEAGLAECDWQDGLADVFYDMASFAIRDSQRTPAARAPIAARIVRLVEANLTQAQFGSVEIAAHLGVSVRTVQNAFAAMGTTPAAYILSRRLTRAAEILRADHAISVTAVAFDLGFSDSGYFARCFRQHFKVSPTHWRQQPSLAMQ